MERENQRVIITKRMLKESMLKLLKSKKLDEISVTELCREAGINRATFYRHYEIPRDVLKEIQTEFYHNLRQQVRLPEHEDELSSRLEELCIYMNAHSELLRILFFSNSDTDFVDFVSSIYLELLREYIDADLLKALNQEDIHVLSLYTAGGSYFVFRSWIMRSIQKSPAEMADYLYSLLKKTEQLLMITLSDRRKITR